MLVEEMTVLENIILGMEPTKETLRWRWILPPARKNQSYRKLPDDVHLDRKVLNISVGEMQRS